MSKPKPRLVPSSDFTEPHLKENLLGQGAYGSVFKLQEKKQETTMQSNFLIRKKEIQAHYIILVFFMIMEKELNEIIQKL